MLVHSPVVKVARSGLLLVLLAAVSWHVLPLVVWQVIVEPELSLEPRADRLDVPMLRDLPEPPEGWGDMTYAGVALRAPLLDSGGRSCDEMSGVCYRMLESGSLSVHTRPPTESFQEMVNFRAPDRDDLGLFRWPRENWDSIEALNVRVTTARAGLDSWRYSARESKGVVAQTERAGKPRYVVAAYSRDEKASRVIGVAGVPRDVLLRMLGSIRFVQRP